MSSGLVVAAAAWLAGGWAYAATAAEFWYAAEFGLAIARGWEIPALPAMIARDALLPAVWIAGWLGSGIEWRGTRMDAAPAPPKRADRKFRPF